MKLVRTLKRTIVVGLKKHRLKILAIRGKGPYRELDCLCDCGKLKTIKAVNYSGKNATKSCGCSKIKHGHTNSGDSGGFSREYSSWDNIKRRCDIKYAQCRRNITYINLAKSGKAIDPRWNKFENFLSDMGPSPGKGYSIDRIDNSKGYWPNNCRWANQKQQCNNTNKNKHLTFNGRTLNLKQWSELLGIKYTTIRTRIRLGFEVKDVLSTKKLENRFITRKRKMK